jgi:hypothetical protein
MAAKSETVSQARQVCIRHLSSTIQQYRGRWWRSWLMNCAASRKVLPAMPWPWCRLNLWQKGLSGLSLGGNDGLCLGLTILPPSCSVRFEILGPQPPGAFRVSPFLYKFCFTCTAEATYLGQLWSVSTLEYLPPAQLEIIHLTLAFSRRLRV